MAPIPEEYLDQFRNYLNDFTPVGDGPFQKLADLLRLETVSKGDYLLREGQISRNLYFVCRGVITSQYITDDGGTHIKNFFLEGNFAASTVSSLLFVPSAFGLQALEDSVVLAMDFRNYRQAILESEALKTFYINYLEKNWVIENERKQIAFATQTARERYLTFLEEYPDLEERIPQLHIASYLGVTPTQLSRIRKNL